jgi:hypothetical protein
MDFEFFFDSISKKMLIDFESIKKIIEKKPTVTGQILENTVREFLTKYFPPSLGITSGYIFDVNGNESRQIDIIIYDAFRTPVFINSENIRVVPAECVYAVIEVKSLINTRELKDIFENMRSVKSLQKNAYTHRYQDAPITWNVYGTHEPIWPINYYVFGFDSMDLKSLKDNIQQFHNDNMLPISKRIDAVCVMKKGIICNYNKDDEITFLPGNETHLGEFATEKALLVFYGLLSHLFYADMPIFVALNYIRKIPL